MDESLSASGTAHAAAALAAAQDEYADEDDDDEGWEDVPSVLDLGLASSKAELMAFGEDGPGHTRQRDDETQAYLIDFFMNVSRENIAGFNDLYPLLTDAEKQKLNELAQEAGLSA